MATYLSPEWLQGFDDAVRADTALTEACAEVQLVIQYEIGTNAESSTTAEVEGEGGAATGEGAGAGARAPTAVPVTYAVRFEPEGPSVVPGVAGDADIVFTADRSTATSIARGEASAQRAVIDGRLTLTGSTTALLGRSDLLAKLGSVLESLRADTTWPDAQVS